MASGVNTKTPGGVQDVAGKRDLSSLGPNARVRTYTGQLATIFSVVTFPGPDTVTGTWIVPNKRVSIAGAATISLSSAGTGYSAVPAATGPMIVVTPDPKVSAF